MNDVKHSFGAMAQGDSAEPFRSSVQTRSIGGWWPVATITHYLLALSLAILLPLLCLAAILTVNYVRAERRVVEAERADITNNVTDLIDREIESIRSILAGLSVSPDLASGNFEAFLRRAAPALKAAGIETLSKSDAAGRRADGGTIMDETSAAKNLRGETVVSGFLMNPSTQRPVFEVTIPVGLDGRAGYALTATVGLERLNRIFAEARLKPDWISAIADDKSQILARSRGAEEFRGRLARPEVLVAVNGSAVEGAFDNVTLDGIKTSTSFRRHPTSGWLALVAVPAHILNAPRDRALKMLGLAAAGLASLGLALAYLLGSRISSAVHSLNSAAFAIVEGRSPPPVQVPIAELLEVTSVFDYAASMANERRLAEQQLRDNDERLRLAVDAGGFGTWDLDLASGRAVCSPRLLSLFGYDHTAGPELSATSWQEHIHPEDQSAVQAEIERARASRANYEMEYRRLRADTGEVRWMRAVGRFTYDDRGRATRMIGVVRDVTGRKKMEADLRDSEARYRAALTVGRIASWETNFATGRRLWSPEGEAVFGLSLEHGTGRVGGEHDEYRNALHPDDRYLVERFYRLAQTEDEFPAEYRIVHPDGQVYWLSGRGKVVTRDRDGKPERLISVVADITERKSAEEHVRFLMGEISHRSKNLLSVVQAIAGQTARNAKSISEFNETLAKRLQGLAASQDVLVNQNWQQAPLRALVQQQIQPFSGDEQSKFKLSGPDVSVSADAAQAIGLALHELSTNAVKYGALSTPAGTISIRWAIGKDGDDHLSLSWIETGGPPVSPPEKKGFGHQVIERMVAHAVAGTVSIDYAPEGLRWRLRIPPAAYDRRPQPAHLLAAQ